MPGYLKQATAAQSRAIGPFVSDTDFKTVQTGLTIANTDIKLVVNGGASANKNSGGGTHRVNGVYGVTFDATDTATVGEMEVSVSVAGALVVFDKFFVLEEAIYDALFAASANGFAGAAGASTVVFSNTSIATVTTVTNQLTAAAIATGVWQDSTAGDFTVASSIGKALYVSNVAPGGSGGHMISGSNAGTTTLGALTVTGATTLTGNMVLSDGLTISAPSTLNRAGIDVTGNGTGAAFKLAAGATGKGIAITTTAGDGLSILPTAGSAIVATGNGTSKHGIIATGGTAGTSDGATFVAGTGGVDFRANQTGSLTGNVSGSVGSVTGAVGSVTGNVGGNVVGSVGSVVGAVGSVTGAVGSVTGNVGGNVLGSVASVTAGVTLAAAAIQAIWDALTAALTTAGSIGKLLVDNINATVSSRATPAQVNTEVVDALATDTYAEPGQAAPGATVTLAAKIGYLYKAWRNRTTQTDTQYSLYADDAVTVDQKATFSDNGTTADRGEVASGP
jgi:hypothetical protein